MEMKCISNLRLILVKAYSSLDIYTRSLVEHSLRKAGRPSLDQLILSEPWAVYTALTSALSRHNADALIAKIHRAILSSTRGRELDLEELKNALSSREEWLALAAKLCESARQTLSKKAARKVALLRETRI